MKSPLTDDEQSLCLCGKVGYRTARAAEAAAKVMRGKRRPIQAGGRNYKDARADLITHYQCARTGSGLWHVGHGNRDARDAVDDYEADWLAEDEFEFRGRW